MVPDSYQRDFSSFGEISTDVGGFQEGLKELQLVSFHLREYQVD